MNVEDDPRLHAAAAAHPQPLLFATISGAHLYGFPSPDSDYDLRGVHVLPLEQVVGLVRGPETIERMAPESGLDLDLVTRADAWARGGLAPRLTLLLDCPVRIGLERARGENDRFHAEEEAFHERVRAGFHALAAAEPGTWQTIDSTQPTETVHVAVLAAVRAALGTP